MVRVISSDRDKNIKKELHQKVRYDLLNLADDLDGLRFVKEKYLNDNIDQCLSYVYKIDKALGGNLEQIRTTAKVLAEIFVQIRKRE